MTCFIAIVSSLQSSGNKPAAFQRHACRDMYKVTPLGLFLPSYFWSIDCPFTEPAPDPVVTESASSGIILPKLKPAPFTDKLSDLDKSLEL